MTRIRGKSMSQGYQEPTSKTGRGTVSHSGRLSRQAGIAKVGLGFEFCSPSWD
jgi:hypothetical protein